MSLIKLKDIFQSAVAVLMTLAFFLPFFFLYPRPYLVGFKYKVLEISSPQELREIADKARILLKEERYLPGPNRFPQEEDYAELWEKMPKAKIFELAYSTVFINVSDNNDVLLTWGSGLVGTWGVRIAEQTVEKSKYDYNYSQIKEDIALFMEPH
jgi:hypothetical protein